VQSSSVFATASLAALAYLQLCYPAYELHSLTGHALSMLRQWPSAS
jgi:hypothetical protein